MELIFLGTDKTFDRACMQEWQRSLHAASSEDGTNDDVEDVEEGPLKIDGGGDPTTEDEDGTNDDVEDVEKKVNPRHSGPQRVIPHGDFRGAD